MHLLWCLFLSTNWKKRTLIKTNHLFSILIICLVNIPLPNQIYYGAPKYEPTNFYGICKSIYHQILDVEHANVLTSFTYLILLGAELFTASTIVLTLQLLHNTVCWCNLYMCLCDGCAINCSWVLTATTEYQESTNFNK